MSACFPDAARPQREDPTTAFILTLLLGGVGAHKFYLAQTGWGIGYLLFF